MGCDWSGWIGVLGRRDPSDRDRSLPAGGTVYEEDGVRAAATVARSGTWGCVASSQKP